MDSEGSFSITWNKHQMTTATSVAIANTDRGLLEFVQSLFGGNIYLQSRTHAGARNKCYTWLASRECVENFVRTIKPYLRCKHRQAEVILEHVSLVPLRAKRTTISVELRQRRLELRGKMLELNKAKIKNQETVTAVKPADWKWKPYVKLAERNQQELLQKASALGAI
jgi:hypothetical protein